MSYKANVYNVMIASPSDVAKERTKVVEALAEWNRHNTAERKCVFLPLRWEEDSAARMGCPPQETLNRQLCERSDMLIAIFWTRLGTPTEGFASGTVEEIEYHLKANKPVMLYFCDRDIPMDTDRTQLEKLKEYRKSVEDKALYHTFKRAADLKNFLLNQLRTAVITDEPFVTDCKKLASNEKEETDKKRPNLWIEINDADEIQLILPKFPVLDNVEYMDENMSFAVTDPDVPEMTFELFEQDARDILNHKIPNDLENWVSEKELAAFKKRIPDIEELETYLRKWKMSLCMENAVELKITLHNDGKAMAEEIYVDMDEPENVWVIDEDEWESLSKFSTISDPVHAARQKKAIHKIPSLEMQNAFDCASRVFLASGLAYPSELMNVPVSLLTPFNKDFYRRVEDGDVVLHLDKLLQGRMVEFKKIYMIPKKVGEADIKVAYQCRQFPDAVVGKIKVEVLAEDTE